MKIQQIIAIACAATNCLAAESIIWNSSANGNWSTASNWDPATVPNAAGVEVVFDQYLKAVTVDTPTTIGSIILIHSGSPGADVQIKPTQALTFNSGNGSMCIISNASTSVKNTDRIMFSSGSIVLASDLGIFNTGTSSKNTQSIGFSSTISGNGNITVYNVVDQLFDEDGLHNICGSINLSAKNTFVGNLTLRRGIMQFANTPFGASENIVYLGEGNANDVHLVCTSTSQSLSTKFVVSEGCTGQITFGDAYTNATEEVKYADYNGTFNLGSDLIIWSHRVGTSAMRFRNVISGSGAIVQRSFGKTIFQKSNTYSGGTTLHGGVLEANATGSLGSGNVEIYADKPIHTIYSANKVANTLDYSGCTRLEIGAADAIADTAKLSFFDDAEQNTFAQILVPEGMTETVKTVSFNGRLGLKGSYGAAGSGADFIDNNHFMGKGILVALDGAPRGTVIVLK